MPEQTKTTTPVKKSATPSSLKLVPPADLLSRAEKIYDSIAQRAFELFEGNGRVLGRDLEDWFRAESEFLHPVPIDIEESEGVLAVRAEVPGFSADQLELSIEPRRMTVSGKRETDAKRTEKKLVYQERRSDEILRVIDLPATVDAERAMATLKDGLLEVKAPKATPSKAVSVLVKSPNEDPEC
jgi:HSP20 family protein